MVTLERLSGSLSPKLLNIPASFSTYIIKYWIIKCATPSVYYVSLSMILVTDQKNTRAEIQNSLIQYLRLYLVDWTLYKIK